MDLETSIGLSVQSLAAYGGNYRHWAIAYSGGKDSTATVAFVAWQSTPGLSRLPNP